MGHATRSRYWPSYVGVAIAGAGRLSFLVAYNVVGLVFTFVGAWFGMGGLLKAPGRRSFQLFELSIVPMIVVLVVLSRLEVFDELG